MLNLVITKQQSEPNLHWLHIS